MSWAMGALAAQHEYKPMPWGSDPWVNRLGPTREMAKTREAELADQRAAQVYADQQAANADVTQAYRGTPRLDPGIRREPGSVAPTPIAEAIGEAGGDILTDPLNYTPLRFMKGAPLAMGAAYKPEEAEAGTGGKFWHGISGIRLPKPIDAYSATKTPRGSFIGKPIRPEDLKGMHLWPTIADTTDPASTLTHIDDWKLPEPRDLQGGLRFSAVKENNPLVWMSEKGPMTSLAARSAEQPTMIVPTALSPPGADYSHHVWATLVDKLKDTKGISKADRDLFTQYMREDNPTFPGVNARRSTLLKYFDEAPRGPRVDFVKGMDTRHWQDKGFPDVSAIRHAVTDPELLHAPLGSSGRSMFRLDPGSVQPSNVHGTYKYGGTGEYGGDLGFIAPPELMFEGPMKSLRAMAKASGKPLNKYVGRPDYYFQGRIPTELPSGKQLQRTQFVDQRWIDRLSDYGERYKKVGGAAALAAGMTLAEIAKAEEADKAARMGALAAQDNY